MLIWIKVRTEAGVRAADANGIELTSIKSVGTAARQTAQVRLREHPWILR